MVHLGPTTGPYRQCTTTRPSAQFHRFFCGSSKGVTQPYAMPNAAYCLFALALFAGACGPKRDCASECNCKQHGHCEEEKGKCIAGTNAECKRSEICRVSGQCGLEKGRCIASREEDCRASELCKKAGACTLKGDRCVR